MVMGRSVGQLLKLENRLTMTLPIMFIVGDASGDNNVAEIIKRLTGRVPVFGAGVPKMQATGIELLFDLTERGGAIPAQFTPWCGHR